MTNIYINNSPPPPVENPGYAPGCPAPTPQKKLPYPPLSLHHRPLHPRQIMEIRSKPIIIRPIWMQKISINK